MWDSSQTDLAVGKAVVAVAVGNPADATTTDIRIDSGNWKISLLLFDAKTGKLRSKHGGWSADRYFRLLFTSHGNFLLLLRHFHQGPGETGETLHLISPEGQELKKLALPPWIHASKPDWNNVLISPTGRTMLVAQQLGDYVHYRILDTDSLETTLDWSTPKGQRSPWVTAISDTELLGLGAAEPGSGTNSEAVPEFYLRPFAGTWTSLRATFNLTQTLPFVNGSNSVAFLSGDALIGLSPKQGVSESPILVLPTDGSRVFSPAIPKLEANTSLTGPITVSQDGRFFAVGFRHRPWLSHLMLDVWKLDDTLQNDQLELVIWQSSRPAPFAKLNLGSDVDVQRFSLVPDDSPALVLLGRGTLKLTVAQPIQ